MFYHCILEWSFKVKGINFNKNDEIILEIDDNGATAEGIAHIDGYSFFVKDVIKTERIRAVITKLKKNYGYAKCVELLSSSKDRVNPKCKYYKLCGGCNIQHMDYKAQLDFKLNKINQALQKIGGLSIKADKMIAADKVFRYRNKAQYPVGISEKGELTAGFYSARSHRIVSVEDCLLEPEINSVLVRTVLGFCQEYNITAYREETHSGELRHIMIRHADKTGEIMLCLVLNSKGALESYQLEKLNIRLSHTVNLFNEKNGLKYKYSSLVINYNNKKTNVIMSDITEVIYGRNFIIDEMNGIQYAIGANSFYQVNHNQAEKLYQTAAEVLELNKENIVFDMYCGAGTIGLYLADKVKYVYGAEIVSEAVEMAKYNTKLNHIENAEFFCGSADDVANMLYKEKGIVPDIIVVDPPRKGCSNEMIDTMLNISANKIAYVSCDPATMARDLKRLTDGGEYKVEKVVGVDQFCQTFHVEVITLLSKPDSKRHISVEITIDELDLTSEESKTTYKQI